MLEWKWVYEQADQRKGYNQKVIGTYIIIKIMGLNEIA